MRSIVKEAILRRSKRRASAHRSTAMDSEVREEERGECESHELDECRERDERRLEAALLGSFPASDAPSSWAGPPRSPKP